MQKYVLAFFLVIAVEAGGFTGLKDEEDSVCLHSIDAGPCKKLPTVTKWAFDWEYGKCIAFQFTGCGGTANRFDSFRECEQACPSSAPLTPSNRIARFLRYV